MQTVAFTGVPQSSGKGQQQLKTGTHQYMMRGASEKAGASSFVVAAPEKTTLQLFDRQLKQFQFREALDTSLEMGNPVVVGGLLEELACRNALDSALGESHLRLAAMQIRAGPIKRQTRIERPFYAGGRDLQGLLMILAFTARHMADPRCGKALLGAAHRLLDIYSSEVIAPNASKHLF